MFVLAALVLKEQGAKKIVFDIRDNPGGGQLGGEADGDALRPDPARPD